MENKQNINSVTLGMWKRFLVDLGVKCMCPSDLLLRKKEELVRDMIINGSLGCNNHETGVTKARSSGNQHG